MAKFEDYSEVVFWDFKRMDNVNYNFNIAERLINCALKSDDKNCFYKPIYLILAAIIECTLYDFLKKINEHRYEQVPNLTPKEIQAIQNMTKVPNKLKCFNDICKKHQLLGASNSMYDNINTTSEIRNRIHIQNEKRSHPKDESDLWSDAIVISCGQLLKDIFTIMCNQYPRPGNFHKNPDLQFFPEPWKRLNK